MPGYGTLSPPQEEFQWERRSSPLQLFLSVGINVGKNVVALLLLFWQLFRQRTFLMSCDKRVIGNWTYPCEYTKTFIRCFPLLATICLMIIASRQMLQQRIYYGLLKRGALLDFRNTKAWHDPLFFILVVSFLHGIIHFILDLFVQDGYHAGDLLPGAPARNEMEAEMQNMLKHFILPSVVFFAFLVSSYDLEAQLLPLSKYFEENPSYARQTAARMPFLDEEEVQKVIPRLSLKISSDTTTLDAVYHELIEKTPELFIDEKQEKGGISWHLFKTLWPAKILLDPKLDCDEAKSFRRLLFVTNIVSALLHALVFVYFCYQAYQDVMDVHEGQYEDSMALIVLVAHAAVAGYMSVVKARITKIFCTG